MTPTHSTAGGRTVEMTYAEKYLLGSLAQFGPRGDFDTIPERVLVNTGLAERFSGEGGWGMIRITDAGRAALKTAGGE